MSTRPKILLVEDDDLFRTTLVDSFSRNSFDVVQAEDGLIAKTLLENHAFDLILSDIKMPNLNGVELLRWVQSTSKTPFVLMTGFSQIIETKKAHELGAVDFIAKPFSEAQIIEFVKKHLVTTETPAAQEKISLDNQFCKVSINHFISQKEAECFLYLRISEAKYIKVSHKGGTLSDERIKSYAEKGIHHVYMELDDFARIVRFNVQASKVIQADVSISISKKLSFIIHTCQLILENASAKGLDETVFSETSGFLYSCMSLICDESNTAKILELLSADPNYLYAHSLGVSIFSVIIGKGLGHTSASVLFKLAMAGLFHDIGKSKIAPAILEKPRALLSQNERKQLETHALLGRDILLTIKSMPSEVAQIVYEHHETANGKGYPRGLNKDEIFPLARAVQLANIFCEYVIRTSQDGKIIDVKEAFKKISAFHADEIDLNALAALKRVFHQL